MKNWGGGEKKVMGTWHPGWLVLSPLTRGSVRRRAYCSADMQVHWGSWRTRDGDAGVLSGFLLAFTLPLPGGSNFSEYDDEAFRENLKEGDCKTSHYH